MGSRGTLPRGWPRLRAAVLQRDRYRCWLCGQYGATSVDHVVPRDKGGGHGMDNLRAAHRRCNTSKGTKPVYPAAIISERWR